jgi:hypothetical protein
MAQFLNHPVRLAALAAGQKTFDTGKPCANGHSSPRYTSSGICVACNNLRNAKRALKMRRSRPARVAPLESVRCVASTENGYRVSTAQHARRVEAAEKKFPTALLHAISDYQQSSEGRQRSKYLDGLIRERGAIR